MKNKYSLEIIVFISGAVVMITEIVGSRILAPYIGTTIFVWTSLIGIILGCLSLGYWYGGRVADKKPNYKTFSAILFGAAFFIGLIVLIKDPVLVFVQEAFKDIRASAVIATLLLFAVPSFFLGMVSPYAVKLKMKKLDTSGKTVGNLYAISTIGSIVGTFVAGFFLIAYFGSTKILLILSLSMVVISIVAYRKGMKLHNVSAIFIVLFAASGLGLAHDPVQKDGSVELDSQYNHIKIMDKQVRIQVDGVYQDPKKARVMKVNSSYSSVMSLEDDELVEMYTRYYRLAEHFNPTLKSSLMLGGAGCSYPKDFLINFPESEMDVVEIDPKLTEMAKEYFDLRENPRLKFFHEDARTYLNRNKKQYDVIFVDVFNTGSNFSIPFQLTTREAVKRMHNSLSDDGFVLMNVISAIKGEKGKFLRAEYATFKSVFPQVYLFTVDSLDGSDVQNIMFAALKTKKRPLFKSRIYEFNRYLKRLWVKDIELDVPVLIDDYAPVEQLMKELI
ncbi:fused MFS/spermidine synthase [Thermodesulfobacteriota bacterium]